MSKEINLKDKEQPPERPTTKPPIYPVWVIEVACQALHALVALDANGSLDGDVTGTEMATDAGQRALRIIRDGLESHERAIKGEP